MLNCPFSIRKYLKQKNKQRKAKIASREAKYSILLIALNPDTTAAINHNKNNNPTGLRMPESMNMCPSFL